MTFSGSCVSIPGASPVPQASAFRGIQRVEHGRSDWGISDINTRMHAVRWEEWRSSSSVEIATETIGLALNAMDNARPRRESEHPVLSSRMTHRTARKNLAFFRSVLVYHGMRQLVMPL